MHQLNEGTWILCLSNPITALFYLNHMQKVYYLRYHYYLGYRLF